MNNSALHSIIEELYTKSPEYRAFLRILSKKKKNVRVLRLDPFMQESRISNDAEEVELTRPMAIEFLRALDAAQIGRFLIGRRGKPTRFEWEVELTTISEIVEKLESSLPKSTDFSASKAIRSPLVRREFPLRENLTLNLELPPDLTPTEADRLSMFLKSICISQS